MDTRRLAKLLIGVIVIGGASAYLLVEAFRSSLAYYYSVDEFLKTPSGELLRSGAGGGSGANDSRLIRLAGIVKDGSITRRTEDGGLGFELAGRQNSVPVRYVGIVPENFAEGREVVVEGRVSHEGVFAADSIMTRCESKYRVKLDSNSMRK